MQLKSQIKKFQSWCWFRYTLRFTQFRGRIQFVVLTTLPLKFKGFQGNNRKSEITVWWRNYLDNLQKIWSNNLRKNVNKLSGSQYPVAQFLWTNHRTNDVTKFSKVTYIISPMSCHLRFLIVVLVPFNSRRKDWRSRHYHELNHT